MGSWANISPPRSMDLEESQVFQRGGDCPSLRIGLYYVRISGNIAAVSVLVQRSSDGQYFKKPKVKGGDDGFSRTSLINGIVIILDHSKSRSPVGNSAAVVFGVIRRLCVVSRLKNRCLNLPQTLFTGGLDSL